MLAIDKAPEVVRCGEADDAMSRAIKARRATLTALATTTPTTHAGLVALLTRIAERDQVGELPINGEVQPRALWSVFAIVAP